MKIDNQERFRAIIDREVKKVLSQYIESYSVNSIIGKRNMVIQVVIPHGLGS